MKTVLLTVLTGVALDALRRVVVVEFGSGARLWGALSGRITEEDRASYYYYFKAWQDFEQVAFFGFMIAAVASGKYLLARLTAGTPRTGEVVGLLIIILLGLGLATFEWLALPAATRPFLNAIPPLEQDFVLYLQWEFKVDSWARALLMIAGVALGHRLLVRQAEESPDWERGQS